MLTWMIYVVIVTIPLSLAAFVAEFAAQLRQAPRRWIWITAILTSLLLPSVIASVSVQVPNLFEPTSDSVPVMLRDTTSVHLPAAITHLSLAEPTTTAFHRDALLPVLWAVSSALILLALCLSAGLLYWRKRRWTPGRVCDAPVLIAPDVGPAVVGLLRPAIVLPAWLMHASVEHQQLVMAHEQSHLDARDPQLLTLALCLLVVMPWNLPLWWQLHRLRRALEVDCDARVLRGGRDVRDYCETLIEVGQNQSTYIGAAAAMSESKSFLEQRIRIMLLKPMKWARVSATALACLSVAMVAFAAQVSPPNAPGGSQSQPADVDSGKLAGYEGFYKFSVLSVMKITHDGVQLSAQLSGQQPVQFSAVGNSEFLAKALNARISFVQNSQGQTTGMIFRQNGHEIAAPRVSEVAGGQINSALSARVAGQQPFPGSDKALRLLLSDPDDSTGMSQEIAQARSEQKTAREKYLAKLGPVTSYEFAGVTNQGWDKYLVRHEHGSEDMLFVLDSNGTIVGAVRHP